ncbi:MAG: ribonuclease HI [Deltaproteobacteria bacterium]|nr:ribonuclease HI [Deltaproteobacteria bacterium]MBW1919983.1 ribonuclease HI [Deltaproteobacteria bacterium]MBW1936242.1 ribonuclease HI [Deltaproteobacteria bacterium]MBW1977447.1 ribonuclease HI [Deltaproteobacteria bacterium]MBW2043479.1 ribonuclease HI [Deltaproteobacteria bacterium]
MNKRKQQIVQIFADGACSGNPGPGGYGAILKYGDKVKEISGCSPRTTNNRMEMMAVIESLKLIKKPSDIVIITDSNYVVKGMTDWVNGWRKKGWLNSRKKPVLNRDLWQEILKLSKPHNIEWKWIKGHNGHKENERCDELARKAIVKCARKSKMEYKTKWMKGS